MSSTDTQEPREYSWESLKLHISNHKIEFGLWTTRLLTMLFSFLYLVSIMGNPYNAYYKALLANAATSALRLHQRQPAVTPSRAFIAAIIMEDSFHYLIYSLIFMYAAPLAFILIPIFLFSLIHFASYSLTLLDKVGQNSWWAARLMISLVELQSRNILSLIACTEILLMPFSILLVFLNRATLLTPVFYYQFLLLRYKSIRNPYTRRMFHEFRLKLEEIAQKSSTPAFIQKIIFYTITFISRLAPVIPPQGSATN